MLWCQVESNYGRHAQEWNNIGQADARTNVDISRYNLGIAQATHSDSKQMRSIAMLTMIFLPATFVAVCPLHIYCKPYTAPIGINIVDMIADFWTQDFILHGLLRLEA